MEATMRVTALALLMLMIAGPALADPYHEDDTGYGLGGPCGGNCDPGIHPGKDGVDWDKDNDVDEDDAKVAPKDYYYPGYAGGPNTDRERRAQQGNRGGAMQQESGHGSSDGGRGPK
jgi:hypothetical protein